MKALNEKFNLIILPNFEMFQSESKPLHCLEKVANVFLILTSLVFVGLGTFLCIEVKTLYMFEGILIILGICSLVLVFLFQCSKSPANILNCYLYGLSGLVVFQTIISIMALVSQNGLVDWILRDHILTDQNQKEYEASIRHKIRIFVWIGFAASLIQVIQYLCKCYLFTYGHRLFAWLLQYSSEQVQKEEELQLEKLF